jgi:hypothetical protein
MIHMSKYEKHLNTPFDDRAEAYTKSGDMVVAIARTHAGVDVDEETHARWRQMMGLMREVDTWADDTDATTFDVVEGLATFELFRERYPDLAPEKMDPSMHEALALRTIRILKLGQSVAQAETPKRYVALRIAEAREAVNLFDDTASPYVHEQSAFDQRLMPTLRALGETATLWDSIIDGKKDVRTGKQVVEPSPEYYARLTSAMLVRAARGAPALLHVEPNVQLAIKVGMRVKNRISNGVPEYSSLRTFSRKSKS